MTRKLLEELESSQNGSFELTEEKGKAVLRIFNPTGKGRAVHPTDLNNRLRSMHIVPDKDVSVERLLRSTQEGKIAEGEAHVIGDWPKVAQRKDAVAEVEVSDDHMSAHLFLQPPEGGGKAIPEERLRALLREHGVIKGLLDDTLRELGVKPSYKRMILVAQGKEPVRGKNGFIQPLFETMTRPRVDPKAQKIDHKQVNLIKSAKAGEVIAEKIDPTVGETGFTVGGKLLPAEPGVIAEFIPGANVEISPDGKKLISKIEGRPVLESNGKIRVDEVVYLKNIDYSTGNVDFPGSVIVEESVADGFKLHASGSIILQSSVGVCEITAGKDIILSAGFMGRGEGKITSDGDVYARFVEQGTIIAKGSIFISEATLHSHLVAGGSIVVKGGRGDITGGDISAGKFVHCNKLGGAGETRTVLTVGIDPTMRSAIDEIHASLKEKEVTLDKIRVSLNRLNDAMKKRKLDAKEAETREKLLLAMRKYKALVESDQRQLESAQNSYLAHDRAYVLVENQLYPNVEINFGKGMLFRSGMRAVQGKQAIYVGEDRTVIAAPTLPKYLEKQHEEHG
ncbi:MAG: FapA family protein [Turneriella sp.]|nr:FapA family protein [Turneriella sp.]